MIYQEKKTFENVDKWIGELKTNGIKMYVLY